MLATVVLLLVVALPSATRAAIQCYVGQKLFALESNMIRMERDGESRALVQLEICQFEREFEQCKEDKASPEDIFRINQIQQKLEVAKAKEELKTSSAASEEPITSTAADILDQKVESSTRVNSILDEVKEDIGTDDLCEKVIASECGHNIYVQINACCKDLAACDRNCLKGVERNLLRELTRNEHGCTSDEVRATLDCLALKVSKKSKVSARSIS